MSKESLETGGSYILQVSAVSTTQAEVNAAKACNKDQCLSCSSIIDLSEKSFPPVTLIMTLYQKTPVSLGGLICHQCAEKGEGFYSAKALEHLKKIGLLGSIRPAIFTNGGEACH